MEHIIKQLKNGAKNTRLSVAEKADMKRALVLHVQANPIKANAFELRQSKKHFGILSPLQINSLRNRKTMPIFVILGLLMSGSASFAAENTVPGDVLYPVKVHVNESVRGAVAVSPTAKAEWEVRLVERRLEEVKKLAVAPNVEPTVRQEATQNVVVSAQQVENRIHKFEEEKDEEHAVKTSTDLATILAAYEQALAIIAAKAQTPATSATASGSVATSTATTTASVATSTATTTTPVATTTPATTTPVPVLTKESIEALREVLHKLSEVRGDVEEHYDELKKKYRKESHDDEDEEDDYHGVVTPTPQPAPAPVATSTATTTTPTATSTATTTATSTVVTVGTSTATTTVVLPPLFGGHDRDDHDEEIRGITASSTATTKTREEQKREKEKSRESSRTNDSSRDND